MRNILAGLALLASLASPAFSQTGELPPFRPVDPTTHLAVTGTAANLTLPTALSGTGSVQYVLTSFCTASELVFFRRDGVTVTVSTGMPVIPNNAILVTLPASTTTLSFIGSGTACTVYATVGVGT